MNLGLKDTLPFGKHKSRKVEDVFKDEDGAGYLVWLRDIRKKENGDEKFFDLEVSTLLDMAIRASKPLAKRFKPFNMPLNTDPVKAPAPMSEQGELTREVAYKGWGEF